MIQSNLSTRPFYNEIAIRFWLLIALIVIVAATLFNVSRSRRYSGTNTELAAAADRDTARAAELRAAAFRLHSSVDLKQLEAVSTDARQANDLIDRRTFSWTELFNLFETTLPADVRITAVRPTLSPRRETLINVTVVARSVDDVNQFMENLDGTGAFARLTPTTERINEDGQVESALEAIYRPAAAAGVTGPPVPATPPEPPAAAAPVTPEPR